MKEVGHIKTVMFFTFFCTWFFFGVSYSFFQIEYVMIGLRIHNHCGQNNS